MRSRTLVASAALLAVLASVSTQATETPVEVLLAEQGQACLPVVVSTQASKAVTEAASELAGYLGKITGASFKVQTGDGTDGVAVGTASDFPALPYQARLVVSDIPDRERYILQSQDVRFNLYFYVPKGTKHVDFYAKGVGLMLGANGERAFNFTEAKKGGYHRVPVSPGHDGRLWKLHGFSGQIWLANVPPCLARRADELLLPRAIVEAASHPGATPR